MKWRLILSVAFAMAFLLTGIVHQARTLDGLTGMLCMLENTQYAEGYSEAAFHRVTPRMTESEARRVLGEPLNASDLMSTETDMHRSLFYSYRIRRGCYRLRTIVLLRKEVIEVAAECTCD